MPRLSRLDLLLLAGLAAAAGAAVLPGLGVAALANWDEATYGALVREFLDHPRLSLVYNGVPYLEKPPLGVWLMAASCAAFGIDEWALRLPVALLGIASVLLTYVSGRRAYLLASETGGAAAAADRAMAASLTGAVAALLLLGVPHFVAWSRLAMLDVPLVALGVLAVALVLHSDGRPARMVAAGAAVGAAVMTKWIAGLLVVPGLLALVAARRGRRALLAPDVLAAAGAAAAVALPWHLEQVAEHGRAFIHEYVVWNAFQRFGTALEYHTGGPLYYFEIYHYNAGPLAWAHAAGLGLAAWLAARRREAIPGAFVALAAGAFGLVSCVATKIGWYVAPVYPGAALAAAAGVALLCRREAARVRLLGLAGLVVAALAVRGAHEARDFVESYHITDFSPEVRLLRGHPPFERRVPHLFVHIVSEPAPHFYLADEVEEMDQAHFEWLAERPEPFLCLTFPQYADELIQQHPRAGLAVVARTASLAVIARR